MNILFLHQNMPGQFKHLAPLLARRGHRVLFLTRRDTVELPGVERHVYAAPRGAGAATHPYLRRAEAAVRFGQEAARGMIGLREQGFVPDLVIAHPGWGEALFVKDVFPHAKLINFCEFYYAGRGLDVGFDPESPNDLNTIMQARVRNTHLLLSLESCDAGVSPTQWQKASHPAAFHDKIGVIFDGIDTERVRPRTDASFALPDGRTLTASDKVVTYVARNLEPYRGFRTFMRALPLIQRAHPDAEVVIVGGDEVSYGTKPKDHEHWRAAMCAEVSFDPARAHFVGKLPYGRFLDLLALSSAHIYLTYPFVLSWSFMEAMASGALLIASDTGPVREVVVDGVNGVLTDFFDHEALAARVDAALADPARFAPLRAAARELAVARYSTGRCLPAWLALIDRVTGQRPAGRPRVIQVPAGALPAA